MSAESRPITPEAFAKALTELPLSSVYAKAAELQNSINHLERSNAELKQFIEETPGGDKDCEEAIAENEEVIKRMLERIELVKAEVARRGQKWIDVTSTNGRLDSDGEEEEGERGGDTAQAETQGRGPGELGPGFAAGEQPTRQDVQNMRSAESGVTNGNATGGTAIEPRTEGENDEPEEGIYL
ncbi:hypothetical protein VTO42DRAFT_6471 [Malbranchea cinnamomea]